ncbi:hypothetical protein [Streptomyces minutiscleroticus]|uniref:Uncharacterized protein n=1 Tax=Streptomyces minutiscleroticus TaxID=68238 RepID=A0A918NWD9_9ACTN|nr:hypothetical protein [Streptomyces minutiscleroticus]GGY01709.1 hypothetical protein GCM10010358_64570 [Streptomyces minutiscleroticus]
MGDEKQQQNDHKADLEQVAQQVGIIDAANTVSDMLSGTFFGRVRFFGTTSFEGHRLNDMIDLVESANPADLESAGEALWNARTAINEAAEELKGHIERVDWEGEAGDAFRTWGSQLVKDTQKLAEYADAAGTQIAAAGTGLASVRSSMPPRDNRSDPKTVDDIPKDKRVESNDEYTAAVKAEKHRQEAINQMNRLASFYKVSEEALANQEPPVFRPMGNVGVPRPERPRDWRGPGAAQEGATAGSVRETDSVVRYASHSAMGDPDLGRDTPPLQEAKEGITYPDRAVGTEINSVGTLPQETRPATSAPSVTTSGGSSGGTAIPPFVSGSAAPAFGTATGRTSGLSKTNGPRTPFPAQGRAGTPGGTAAGSTGRGSSGQGQVGRAAATGQAGARGATGQAGRAAATGQAVARGATPAAGRTPMANGISGGTSRTGGAAAGRVGGTPASGAGRAGGAVGRAKAADATGAGRSGGVVGGKPVTGGTSGTSGTKVPRGTVVGTEGATGPRKTSGTPGQRGVIGAATNPTPGRTPRRSTNNPDGVVGSPKNLTSKSRNRGRFSGGTGLVRGPASEEDLGTTGGARRPQRERSSGEDERRSPDIERRNAPPTND